MKRPSPLVRRGNEVDMDSAMTPMIDVVFLLLVFFVWTASFQVVEHVLPSEMSTQIGSDANPEVEPPPPKDIDDIVIRIGWSGQSPTWSINGDESDDLPAVEQQLKIVAGIDAGVVVILHPDPVVPLGYVIETYDVAQIAGFENVSFAVNPRGQ